MSGLVPAPSQTVRESAGRKNAWGRVANQDIRGDGGEGLCYLEEDNPREKVEVDGTKRGKK